MKIKINKKQKALIKSYILLFIIISVIANWSDVSWIFSYRAVSSLANDFTSPYPESRLLTKEENRINFAPIPTINAAAFPYSEKSNSLEIPSIGIDVPLIMGQSTSIPDLTKDLDKGAVYYPTSVSPGENGQTVILGHSAPLNWPKIKYDWVFSEINSLNPGDKITLHFGNRKYDFRVISKEIVERGGDISVEGLDLTNNNILTLVSCWPPGKDYKRIAVNAELITELPQN